MKRYISLILAAILCCLALTSCGQVNTKQANEIESDSEATDLAPETVYLEPGKAYMSVEITDGYSSLESQTDTIPEQWKKGVEKHTDETAAKSFTAEIFGKTITYAYSGTLERSPLSTPVGNRVIHSYGTDDVGYVSVDAESQKVVRWRDAVLPPEAYGNAFQVDGDVNIIYTIDLEELKQIAFDYAKKLVGEEQLAKYEYVLNEENEVYFYRMINGHKTNEYIYLWFQSDGTLAGFDLCNIGLYNDINSLEFDEQKANDSIAKQLSKRYADKEYKVEQNKIEIVMLPNGQMAYRYAIKTEYVRSSFESNGETVFAWNGEKLTFTISAE